MVYSEIPGCRSCGSAELRSVMEFGKTPLADGLIDADKLNEPLLRVPLTLVFCPQCGLLQIRETVQPRILFHADYPYFSSVSPALMAHSRDNALRLIDSAKLDDQSLVVELASNDGYMLGNFKERGIPVLGIDPADAPVAEARKKGIETLCTFFTEELAEELAAEGRKADVVIANNVLAHVADLNGFVRGLSLLLKDSGQASIEVPYVVDLVQHNEFDTIYHQHLCYFSVSALNALFSQHGLCLHSVDHLAIHGGSLRLTVTKKGGPDESVQRFLDAEESIQLGTGEPYFSLAKRAEEVRASLRDTLHRLKEEGARIAAYAAAAKGTTLLSYCGIQHPLIEYVVDLNPKKVGRYLPGSMLEIRPADKLVEDMPDYTLLLAWNFKDEILSQQEEYRSKGGSFIIPIPEVEIV